MKMIKKIIKIVEMRMKVKGLRRLNKEVENLKKLKHNINAKIKVSGDFYNVKFAINLSLKLKNS